MGLTSSRLSRMTLKIFAALFHFDHRMYMLLIQLSLISGVNAVLLC